MSVQTDKNVVSDLEFALVMADAAPIRVAAHLRYDARDPFAVCVSFDAGGTEPIEWTFARELLDQGLWQSAGEGDVQIWPGGGRVFLALRSPSGQAVLETPRQAIADFVAHSKQVVPAGSESEYVDLDRELDALLS